MNNSSLKTIDILEFVSKSEKPVGVSEISRSLGIAKSTVFDIIAALVARHYLCMDEATKTYTIGLRCYRTGMSYLSNTSLQKSAHLIMERLALETGETVYLAVPSDGHIVYIDKVVGSSPVVFMRNIGAKNHMHITALGKAILAGESDIQSIIGEKLIRRTPNTITDINALKQNLIEVRKNGYATDNGEDFEMVKCYGAPIYDFSNKIIAAISISMLAASPKAEALEIPSLIISAAKEISQSLGYLKPDFY